jgi:hypothetical protein
MPIVSASDNKVCLTWPLGRVACVIAPGAAAGAGVAEGVPGGQQVRVLLVQFGSEPAERAFAVDGPRAACSSLT